MPAPFGGLVVVSIEQAVAAPFCTSRLADQGARVIKIERPEGDFARDYDDVVNGGSAYFDWLNRGKESICLDFKHPDDAALLTRMIDQADILVQNLAPGAAERAGFGAAKMRTRNPRLITCDITGYGPDGPMRDRKAYDLLLQCEAGLASITGTPEAPGRVGISIVDLTCGMNAYAGILEALILRTRTGEGSSLSVSLFDSIADWMTVPLLHQEWTGASPRRVGIAHPSIAPYRVFQCKGGEGIVIAIQNEREWEALATKVLGDPSLLSNDRFRSNSGRTAHREELDTVIENFFRSRTAAEMIALLDDARVAFAVVNDIAGFGAHPQLRRITVQSPQGPVSMPAPPVRWAERTMLPGAVPGLGEHSAQVRADYSHPASNTAKLRK